MCFFYLVFCSVKISTKWWKNVKKLRTDIKNCSKETRTKSATWKHKQKTCFSAREQKIKVPSRLSPSCLLRAGPPSQELRHRRPEHWCTSAHCRVFQTGCYLSAWHSVSRPAEVRMPLTPKESVPKNMVCKYFEWRRFFKDEKVQ